MVESMDDRQRYVRNFSIIAHVDHGKSTLADRLIERCGALESREMRSQVLDSMDIERERGITIKAQTVRLTHGDYVFNIVDTPGHVDFAYEVSRSLLACDGALLVVDASQGVQAQTIANAYLAVTSDLAIVPVINKVDLPSADVPAVRQAIAEVIGLDCDNAVEVSAKTGIGMDSLLDAIIKEIPSPSGQLDQPLSALLVDSWYDPYVGVVTLVRVQDGSIVAGQRLQMVSSGFVFSVDSVGIFTPAKKTINRLSAGDIGYILGGIKSTSDCRVGDTITDHKKPTSQVFKGFRQSVPVVFCGLYPSDRSDHSRLRDSLQRLQLNDSAIAFEPESNAALGMGFRCGCLGLLHLEVILERLEREFDMDVISTAPSIVYKVLLRNGEEQMVHNPAAFPDPSTISSVQELWIRSTIVVPQSHLGAVMELCTQRRGEQVSIQITGERCVLCYDLPLAEVVYDFHDRMKSATRGLGSFDYEMTGFRDSHVVRLSILINGEEAEALSMIVHHQEAERRGRAICEKLREIIPRQMFKVPIQAAIGGKVVARETIAAVRKDVTAKCYGGDITRKRKLLERQREGKKRMQQVGSVEVPKSAFLEVLKIDRA